jgi:hypothetical protein
MTTALISNFIQFFDKDGDPLDDGSIFIGEVNQNPETHPQLIYWDEDATQPIAQPLKTTNGYIYRAGTPAQVFVTGEYSMTIRNKQSEVVIYAPKCNIFPSSADASKKPTTIANIADLRAATAVTLSSSCAQVVGYYSPTIYSEPDQGGGFFIYDSTDTLSTDNGGTIIVDADGRRWKRQVSGRFNAAWFGLSSALSDNAPALNAAIKASLVGSEPYYFSNPSVYIPFSQDPYLFLSTIELTNLVIIYGDGTGAGFSRAPILSWPIAGQTGFHIVPFNAGHTGSGSMISGLHLQGTNGTPDVYGGHGIHAQGLIRIRDFQIFNFQGAQVSIQADTASNTGNANGWEINNGILGGGDYGMYLAGGDVNAGTARMVGVEGCRKWGIYENSFLGNTYVACNIASAGSQSIVTFGGNSYYCLSDSLGGSTTPGTDATVWKLMANGAYPAWVSGGTYNQGGAYWSANPSSRNVFLGCYSESGQPPSLINATSLVLGGLHAAGFRDSSSTPQLQAINSALTSSKFVTGTLSFGDTHLDSSQGLTSGDGQFFNDTQLNGYWWTFSKQVGSWGYQWAGLGTPHYLLFMDRSATPANGYKRNISSAFNPNGSNGTLALDGHYAGSKTENFWRGFASAIPNSGSWFAGDELKDTTPTSGGSIGWVCTTNGTQGTLVGVTATTINGSPTFTVSTTAGLDVDVFISIAGAFTRAKIISIIGTSVTVDANASGGVSAAVTYANAVFKTYGNIS